MSKLSKYFSYIPNGHSGYLPIDTHNPKRVDSLLWEVIAHHYNIDSPKLFYV